MRNGVRLLVAHATGDHPGLQLSAAQVLATSHRVTTEDLALIPEAIEDLHGPDADRARAMLALRAGDAARAFNYAHHALEHYPEPEGASVLALLAGAGCAEIDRQPADAARIDGLGAARVARFELRHAAGGVTAFALASLGGEIVGLWRLRIGEVAPRTAEISVANWGNLPTGTRLRVFSTRSSSPPQRDTWRWDYFDQPPEWEVVPQVLRDACANADAAE